MKALSVLKGTLLQYVLACYVVRREMEKWEEREKNREREKDRQTERNDRQTLTETDSV